MPADRDYTDYQRKIIRRYYDNRDEQDEQRLSDMVTNLYLSSGKKRAKLWESAKDMMLRNNVPPARVEHVLKTDDPAVLLAVVQDLIAGHFKKKTPPPNPDDQK